MPPSSPTALSAAMRPYLDAMWSDRDRLVKHVGSLVTHRLPSYASTPSSEVWVGMLRILERAALGNPFTEPTEEDRLAAIGTGVQGAGAGILAEDLVSAVLLGARAVEAHVLDLAEHAGLDPAALLEASRQSREWAEQMAAWAVQGLRGATETVENHIRHDQLLGELRRGDLEAARSTMHLLSLDSTSQWWAVASIVDPSDPTNAGMTLRLANSGGLWAEPVVGTDGVEHVGLVTNQPQAPAELTVGISTDRVGLAGLHHALRDAARAARVGRRFGRFGTVTLDDLGLLVPVHEDAELAQRLISRWITPLRQEPKHELALTLSAILRHDGHIELVARELAVHPNTVRNRMARVERLLGDWRAPQSRAEIWMALQVSTFTFV